MDDLSDEYYEEYDEDESVEDDQSSDDVVEPSEYAEYAIDGDGNILDYLVYGDEACKVWATLALNIVRERYEIFSDDYGCEKESLIGLSLDHNFIESEAERMISECLTVNEYINGVSNFTMEFEGDKAEVSFVMETEFGEVDMDVSI